MNRKYYKVIIWFVLVFMLLISSITFGQVIKKMNSQKDNKSLYLLSPKGTEILEPKSNLIIQWSSKNIDKVFIQFSIDGIDWEIITPKIEASQTNFNWKISSKLKKQFKIKITDKSDSTIFDVTPYYIVVKSKAIKTKIDFTLNKTSTVSSLKIMPLGNSITEGYKIPLPADFNGYRKPLKEKLENNGLEFDFVGQVSDGTFADNQHEGHGGWHAKHWLDGYDVDIFNFLLSYLQMNPPQIILLHIGTNDIGEYYISSNNNTFNTTVSDVSSLLDIIYNFDPTIKVILAKIINRTDDNGTTINETTTTTLYNSSLEIMANTRIANGDNLSLVDMESALNTSSDLSDGVHPNEIGYIKMASVWYDGIIDILPKLSTKIFLEGSYTSSETMSTLLINSNIIPLNQPFNLAPWNYNGNEIVETIETDIVDWVLVSLRSGTSASTIVAQKAGFLNSNGSIVDLDGVSPLSFSVEEDNYYIVVEHRNHLPIMSSTKIYVSQ